MSSTALRHRRSCLRAGVAHAVGVQSQDRLDVVGGHHAGRSDAGKVARVAAYFVGVVHP